MPFIPCNPSYLYTPFIRYILYNSTPLQPLSRAVYRTNPGPSRSGFRHSLSTTSLKAKSMPTEFKHDGPTRTLGDTERLSDVVKLSAHVTRILGQNPSQMTLQGTCSYLLQPPSSSLAPMILIDTSSPHTSQQYVDLVLTHLNHLGLQSGIREVHFESEYAAEALGHLPKDRDAEEVKVDLLRERADDPRANEVDLVEYGPGAQWVINTGDGKAARERGIPAVEHIILTHRHLDHVGALPTLLKELAKLKLPPPKIWKLPNPDELDLGQSDRDRPTTDAALVNTLPHGLYTPFSPFQPLHPIMPGLMISIIDPTYRHLLKHDRDGKPRWNEVPEIARVSVRCLKTPGHTQDSVSLVMCEGEKGVFTGDTVLGEGTTIFTDLSAYMLSLKTLLAIKPQTLYPGHGKHIPGPEASAAHIEGYIAHRRLREEQILSLLKQIKAGEHSEEEGLVGLLKAFFERKKRAEKAKVKEMKEFMSGKPYVVKPPKGSAEAEKMEKDEAEKAKETVKKEDDMPPRPGTPPPRKKKGEEEEEIVHAEPEKPDERHLSFKENGGAVTLALLTRLLYDTDNEKLIAAGKRPTLAHLEKLEKENRVRRVTVEMAGVVDMEVGDKGMVEAWEVVEVGSAGQGEE